MMKLLRKFKFGIIAYIRALLRIDVEVDKLNSEIGRLTGDINYLLRETRIQRDFIESQRKVNIDHHQRGDNQSRVIFIGNVQGREIVSSYLLNARGFDELHRELRNKHTFYSLGSVDASPGFSKIIKDSYYELNDTPRPVRPTTKPIREGRIKW